MTKPVLGVGKNPAAKSSHIHAITDGNVAICDKRTANLENDSNLSVADVTCTKCAAYSGVKALFEKATAPAPDVGLTAGIPSKPAKKKAEKKAPAKKKKEPAKKKKKPSGDFVAHLKAGRYRVHHIPSERDFFDNIEPEVISFVLEALNGLPVRWLKGTKLPENYITDCRDAVAAVYKSKKMKPPEHLTRPKKKIKKKKKPKPKPDDPVKGDKKNINGTTCRWDGDRWVAIRDPIKRRNKKVEEKPKRSIKRRAKKEKPKRVIKRRPVDEIQKLFGRIPGSPAHAILAMVNEGGVVGDIAKSVSKKFKIPQVKAKAKLLAVIRKTARKQGFDIIHHISGKGEMFDYYEISKED